MMHRVFNVWLVTILACGPLLCGCSGDAGVGGADQVPVHEVSGQITLNGAPVPGAQVSFSPKDGQPPALGRTDTDGRYTLTTYEAGDGAAAGSFVVLVTKSGAGAGSSGGPTSHDAYVASGQNANAMHAAAQKGQGAAADSGSLLPEKYSNIGASPLNVTVPADDPNAYNFDLQP
jgi:hypothetical protein